jgi:hypothetical protein
MLARRVVLSSFRILCKIACYPVRNCWVICVVAINGILIKGDRVLSRKLNNHWPKKIFGAKYKLNTKTVID